jgi:histidinol-phosphate aminotransferase
MLRPNPHIEALAPAGHGGLNYSELARMGIPPEKVLDFSVCTNPFGPPEGVAEAICGACIDRYPDSEAEQLRSLLAQKLNLTPDRILVGSGSTELIRMIAEAYLIPGEVVLLPQPTYSEYELAGRMAGAQVMKLPLPEEQDFRLDITEFVKFIRREPPSAIFLCNPNNPTGHYLSPLDLETILKAIPPDSLLVLDEAYLNFVDRIEDSIPLLLFPNLIIVRSMTKDYALAGLRLGYLLASAPIIEILRRVKPPWNVCAPAQAAGMTALKAEGYLGICRKQILEAKDYLIQELRSLGLSPLSTSTHFFLVRVGNAAAVKDALFAKGVLVRDCTSFGLSAYIRVAARTIPECARLITALKEIEVKQYAG